MGKDDVTKFECGPQLQEAKRSYSVYSPLLDRMLKKDLIGRKGGRGVVGGKKIFRVRECLYRK